MTKFNELLEKVGLMMNKFGLVCCRKLDEAQDLFDYLETLPESSSKNIITEAFNKYDKADNIENPIADVLIPELAKHIEDTLVQCVLGEIWCGSSWVTKNNYFREKAAIGGNTYSAVALGKEYLSKGENKEGEAWLLRAIINGHYEARFILVEHYLKNGYHLDRAKELLILNADFNGDAKSKRKLGEISYIEGNKKEMLKWYTDAAFCGDAFAQCYLGDYYSDTCFGGNDLNEALRWHKEAANNQSKIELEFNNDILTQIYSDLTDNSNYLPSDFGCFCQIKEKLKIPFINPKAVSKFYIAEQYQENGNYTEAINSFEEIKDEIKYSAKRLATIYETLKDYKQALYWSNFAYLTSELGLSCWGANNCGKIYFDILNDTEEGLKWYKKSAFKGDFKATMFLGDYYASNEQYDEAIYWYMKFARGLDPNDLSYCCGYPYDYEKEQSGVANEKLSKLFDKLGFRQAAQYYYFNTMKGIMSKDFLTYLEKIGEHKADQYTILLSNRAK